MYKWLIIIVGLIGMEGVVSVFRSEPRKYSLQTTRSWEFVGLEEKQQLNQMNKEDFLLKARYGREIIVGLLDSGNCNPNVYVINLLYIGIHGNIVILKRFIW